MYSLEVDPNLGLGSWEDGVMDENSDPFPKNTGREVYTNCWSNVWEWGHGEMAYKFANADYKVTPKRDLASDAIVQLILS